AEHKVELQRRAAQAFMSSGHQREGERILLDVLRAVGRPPPPHRAAAIGVYAVERWRLRRRGLERRPAALSPEQRQRVEATDVAAALWMNHDPVASWTYAMRGLRWLLDADDDALLLRALSRELVFAATEPLASDWIDELTALGERLVPRVEEPSVVALYRSAQALRTFLAGDWSKATRDAREAEHLLRT